MLPDNPTTIDIKIFVPVVCVGKLLDTADQVERKTCNSQIIDIGSSSVRTFNAIQGTKRKELVHLHIEAGVDNHLDDTADQIVVPFVDSTGQALLDLCLTLWNRDSPLSFRDEKIVELLSVFDLWAGD